MNRIPRRLRRIRVVLSQSTVDSEKETDGRDELDLGRSTADLDYMHARYCSPHLGRFLSVDPANSGSPENPQSWNRYSYTLGNPVNYVDPDGEISLPFQLGAKGFLLYKSLRDKLRVEPSVSLGKEVGLGVKGAANASVDLTDLDQGSLTVSLQAVSGFFFELGSERFHFTTENGGLLFGPVKWTSFGENGSFPGPTEAEGGFVLGPVQIGGETTGLDEAVSEAFRIFGSDLDQVMAETLLRDLEERGELEEGYVIVHGELIRVMKE